MTADGSVEPLAETQANERAPRFSPDGRWVAFLSDESGRDEVYVQPYPGPGPRTLVSTEGGVEPVWSRDGTELFYRQPDLPGLMGVQVTTEAEFRAEPPQALFGGRFNFFPPIVGAANYDVSPDGQRFLMVTPTPGPEGIRVVTNWIDELARLVPLGP